MVLVGGLVGVFWAGKSLESRNGCVPRVSSLLGRVTAEGRFEERRDFMIVISTECKTKQE